MFNYTFGTITPDEPDEDILIAVFDSDGRVISNAYADRNGKRVVKNLNSSKTYTYTIDASGYETYRGIITSAKTLGDDIVLTKKACPAASLLKFTFVFLYPIASKYVTK